MLDNLRNNVNSQVLDTRFIGDPASDVKITAAKIGNTAESSLSNKRNQGGAILLGYGSPRAVSRTETLLLINAPGLGGINSLKSLLGGKMTVRIRDPGHNP